MFRRISLIGLLGFLLFACTVEPDYSRIAPQDQIGYSGQFLEQIRTGAVEAALEQISPEGRENARPIIENAAQNFPKEEVRLVRVVGYRALAPQPGATGAQPVANIELRYEFANNDALIATIILTSDSQRYFVSFLNFTPLSASLIEQNSFPGPNATVAHWVYLFVAFSVFAFILVTLYFCIRGPAPRWRWRWLWLIAIALGAIRFNLSLVWTTGQMASAISLVPFGVWVARNGIYTPYVISIGFPLGAILFWAMRSRWTNRQAASVAPSVTAEAKIEDKKNEVPSV